MMNEERTRGIWWIVQLIPNAEYRQQEVGLHNGMDSQLRFPLEANQAAWSTS